MTLAPDAAVILAARIFIVLIFAEGLVGKLRHYHEFVAVVANYRMTPESAARPVAVLIIILEGATVILSFMGSTMILSACLAASLLLLFALAMAINIGRGRREIDCGCFQSGLRQHLSIGLILRNIILAGVAILPAFGSSGSLAPLQWLDGTGCGLGLFALYHLFGQLAAVRGQADAFQKRFA